MTETTDSANDRGFTLIELLVYGALSVLVLGLVGGFLINSLLAERSVRQTTESSNSGQVAAQSIARGVRDALYLDEAAGGALLRAVIVDDALAASPTVTCRAWYVTNGEVRTTSSNDPISVPSGPADVAGWTLVATGASPVGTAPVFDVVDDYSVDVKFQIDPANGASILVETTARSRQLDPIALDVTPLRETVEATECF
ncbi:PilW family protein [Herbiconiux sp. SYSU D00978]|uniref:PilW family protein n=1 Tax=Herbiconiux sp. SYSU D00978 TaxID=2812562 RepID=UPI001A96F612|nr:prepilin-type N-terminal cleavage/methylation domain-containing protein [Herbiconiux sp. SYSU D00978]